MLSQVGCPSTVNLCQGGWHPALAMTLLSRQLAKLYSGDGSQGLSGLLSYSCLMAFKYRNVSPAFCLSMIMDLGIMTGLPVMNSSFLSIM